MRPRLDEEAAKQLMSLPDDLRAHVRAFIRELAGNPAALSRPAAFPHPLDGQLADFRHESRGWEHFITVMFKYASDEEHIDIAWLVHLKRPRRSAFDDDK